MVSCPGVGLVSHVAPGPPVLFFLITQVRRDGYMYWDGASRSRRCALLISVVGFLNVYTALHHSAYHTNCKHMIMRSCIS